MMNKQLTRAKRKIRISKKISGTAERPRLVVYRSNLHLYAQIVDDAAGSILAATSTLTLAKGGDALRPNREGASKVGQEIARLAKEKSISSVVFDRNGYLYHGRIKAVAESAREGGLQF
jgi:large subunit ribosomal protein L18